MSYNVERKIANAHFPRLNGSTVHVNDELKIAYNKYSTTTPPDSNKIRINLVFCHGTGLNKMAWHYHIRRLYEISAQATTWYLGSAIAWDSVGHGDSALVNAGKLGWTYGWADSSKDVMKLMEHERLTCNDFLNDRLNKTFVVGHSLGGHTALLCGILEAESFDTVIPIEAAWFGDEATAIKFFRRFKTISQLIIDEFESLEELTTYYTQMSYYNTMDKEILKDFIADEYYTVENPATGEVRYKTKASRVAQMATYLSAYYAIQRTMTLLPYMRSKVSFITGGDATWSPPQSIPYFIEHINEDAFLGHHSIPGASHLANGDKPELLLDILKDIIEQRAAAAQENKNYYPEILYGGDANKIVERGINLLLDGQVVDAVTFEKPDHDSKL